MNFDHFETEIQRQLPRQVPAEWRAGVLQAVNQARLAGSASPGSRRVSLGGLSSALRYQLSVLLWPSPQAWAGLAAIWLLILGLNLASATRAETPAGDSSTSPTLMALQEQERLLSELLRQNEPAPSRTSNPAAPRSRSERQGEDIEDRAVSARQNAVFQFCVLLPRSRRVGDLRPENS